MSNLSIINGNILFKGRVQRNDIGITGEVISKVGDISHEEHLIDATDCYVLPGLIDLHTHGIGYESCSSESLEKYAWIEASRGCTTFIPTLFGPPDETAYHMRRHRKDTDEFRQLPQIGGFRLESPYLAYTGGGISADLAPISNDITNKLMEAGGGHIKIWDVSPELEYSSQLISSLSGNGIVCSIAHTHGTIEQMKKAVNAGARLVTHLFDTFDVPEMTDPGVYPVGLIDYLLVEDRVACEIIADGTHVQPLLVEKTLRCKPESNTIFVTDSNYGAGLPPGIYDLPGGWGKACVDGSNNGVRLIDRNMALCGSALTPIDAFRNAMNLFGKDINTAIRLCSTNPARLLGLNKGEIAVGWDADLIILNDQLDLLYTIVRGEVIYSK